MSRNLIFIGFVVGTWACGAQEPSAPATDNLSTGGGAGESTTGSGTSGNGGGSNGTSGDNGTTGTGGDSSSGGGGSGSMDDASVGSAGSTGGGGIAFDGGVNMIPAGYTGTPFVQNVIPGFLYVANYDKGGPGVAYCHTATAMGAACANGIKMSDWCCSNSNAQGTGARCDQRNMAKGPCPLYRPDSDNAGLSHMNLGEVDTFAANGPTWVAGANGPTLTGPMVTVGTPVPQHADMTTQDDTYLSYTVPGEWQKYTVQVLSAGTYSIGALMGTPPNSTATFDFGNGVNSGPISLPASPVSPACKCIEAYHAWYNSANIGKVTIPAAGTYVMTLTLNMGTYNPLFFTFTKM
jgi:hypothetical protein